MNANKPYCSNLRLLLVKTLFMCLTNFVTYNVCTAEGSTILGPEIEKGILLLGENHGARDHRLWYLKYLPALVKEGKVNVLALEMVNFWDWKILNEFLHNVEAKPGTQLEETYFRKLWNGASKSFPQDNIYYPLDRRLLQVLRTLSLEHKGFTVIGINDALFYKPSLHEASIELLADRTKKILKKLNIPIKGLGAKTSNEEEFGVLLTKYAQLRDILLFDKLIRQIEDLPSGVLVQIGSFHIRRYSDTIKKKNLYDLLSSYFGSEMITTVSNRTCTNFQQPPNHISLSEADQLLEVRCKLSHKFLREKYPHESIILDGKTESYSFDINYISENLNDPYSNIFNLYDYTSMWPDYFQWDIKSPE
jgi:hypothetical protein